MSAEELGRTRPKQVSKLSLILSYSLFLSSHTYKKRLKTLELAKSHSRKKKTHKLLHHSVVATRAVAPQRRQPRATSQCYNHASCSAAASSATRSVAMLQPRAMPQQRELQRRSNTVTTRFAAMQHQTTVRRSSRCLLP